ncbi:hypothetical protein AZ14_0919, partial [Bordetella bronchiseptica 980]
QTLTLAYEHLDQRADGQMSTPTGIGNYTETRRHVNSYTGVYLGDFGRHHVQARRARRRAGPSGIRISETVRVACFFPLVGCWNTFAYD